jgi:hypothetical protein
MRILFIVAGLTLPTLALAAGCIVENNTISGHHKGNAGGAGGASSSVGTGTGGQGTGGGVDVPLECKSFCATMDNTCVNADRMYDDTVECYSICNTLPLGAKGDMMTNTVGCRAGYLQKASQSGQQADVECIHAGPSAGGNCGDVCDNFCYLATRLCTGKNEIYKNEIECKSECQAYKQEAYHVGATGNNLACRFYELVRASESPDDHCKEATLGSKICVDPIDAGPDVMEDANPMMDSGTDAPVDDGGGMMDAGDNG